MRRNIRQTLRFADDRTFFWVSFVPTALIVLILLIFPIVFTLVISFFYKNLLVGPFVFAGLDNFEALLKDPQFWLSFKNGIIYSGGSTFFSIVFGMFVAMVLNQNFKGRSILRAIVIFPYIVPPIVALFIWKFLINSRGIINVILSDLGIISEYIPWLGDSRYAMITAILISSWVWFPFSAINFLAGLQGIPQDVYEAAAIDGASGLESFRHITVPLLSPVISVMVILRFIWACPKFRFDLSADRGWSGRHHHGTAPSGIQGSLQHLPPGLCQRRGDRPVHFPGRVGHDLFPSLCNDQQSHLFQGTKCNRDLTMRQKYRLLIVYPSALIIFIITMFPFYWMVTASVKPFKELLMEASLVPRNINFTHYYGLFEQTQIVVHLKNSIITSVAATLITLILASMAGYAITRYDIVAGEFIARLTLFTYMVPSIVLLLPLYLAMKTLGLVNSHFGLVISYLTITRRLQSG